MPSLHIDIGNGQKFEWLIYIFFLFCRMLIMKLPLVKFTSFEHMKHKPNTQVHIFILYSCLFCTKNLFGNLGWCQDMRQIYIFSKISNEKQCWFTQFVRFTNMKLFLCWFVVVAELAEQFQVCNSYKTRELLKKLSYFFRNIEEIWICLLFICL